MFHLPRLIAHAQFYMCAIPFRFKTLPAQRCPTLKNTSPDSPLSIARFAWGPPARCRNEWISLLCTVRSEASTQEWRTTCCPTGNSWLALTHSRRGKPLSTLRERVLKSRLFALPRSARSASWWKPRGLGFWLGGFSGGGRCRLGVAAQKKKREGSAKTSVFCPHIV